MPPRKLSRALNWLFGTPVISGAIWVALTFLIDWIDVEQQSQGRPVLMLGAMLILPVILVGTIAGVIVALWSLSWD